LMIGAGWYAMNFQTPCSRTRSSRIDCQRERSRAFHQKLSCHPACEK
jgi:hypothetical protein